MNDFSLKTRREFLRTSLVGGAMSWTVPSFIHATIQSLFTTQADAAVAPVNGKDGPILVVLQLAGGNDGLNTVVPIANDFYYRARPTLGIKAADTLRLNDDIGLHASLAGLRGLYDEGHLTIIQGVGYPNPNRSHFRSTEIWHTGSDANKTESFGWLGRFFDSQCQGEDASCGIAIGSETPQAFFSRSSKGITLSDTQNFRLMTGGAGEAEMSLMEQLNGMADDESGASIAALAGSKSNAKPGEHAIDFLERIALDAKVNAKRIRDIAARGESSSGYPQTRIGRELQLIGKMIGGGMTSRIYYATQGGYDTHTGQVGSQARLLKEFSDAMAAFIADLQAQGNLDRVMVMTFSEFGRRVAENQSGGTDHGAAAPLFIAGGRMARGIIGSQPSLKPEDLEQGDIRHSIDFRSVYATLLERHMKVDAREVLGRAFSTMDFIASPAKA